MPRVVTVTVPPERTDSLLQEIRDIEGILGLRAQKGISLQPPGDVITVEITNRSLPVLSCLLDECGIGHTDGSSITMSEPTSVVSSSSASAVAQDTSESTWEETEVMIGKESNMTASAMWCMAIAGMIAAVGIATNALHLVIGAMVIAPGFEPITRISLGWVSRSHGWQRGIKATALGYLAMLAGAVVATLLLRLFGTPPLGEKGSYLPPGTLITYWTSVTPASVLVTLMAGVAGALLVVTRRSVLTAGVMIALALVPAITIAGMAAVSGEMALAGRGMMRWTLEAGAVALASWLVFAWQQDRIQKRPMRL
ncbi:MAG: DUF389 domain-containing protein [Armatimonadetes bacterium]|nr:DUF389 domain-containing protein [Armatimonadota bacterium]